MTNRDYRLNEAMDLLTTRAKPRSGLVTMVAVAGFALSGALLATVAGSEAQKPAVAVAEQVDASAQAVPQADFEVSAKPAVVEH